MGGWLLSGAKDGVNWIERPPPQRIEGNGPVGHGDNGDRGGQVRLGSLLPWRTVAVKWCTSKYDYRTVENSETCSRWLAAPPNMQADGGSVLYAAVDGAGQGEASA